MAEYSTAIDQACDELAVKLGRALHSDEVHDLEDRLFRSWLEAGKFQELVEYALEEFELQDGEAFCASLGNALCKAQKPALAERLFIGLASAREAAFWRVWPQAQQGHIGAIKEAAIHQANTMKSLAELYRSYSALANEAGKGHARSEMLRMQERLRASNTRGGTK